MTQGEAPGFKAISWKTSIFIGSDDQQEKKPKQTHQPALFRPFAPGPTSTRRRWTWRARVCCEIGEKRGEGRRRSGGRGRPSRFPLVDEDGGGGTNCVGCWEFPWVSGSQRASWAEKGDSEASRECADRMEKREVGRVVGGKTKTRQAQKRESERVFIFLFTSF